MNGVEYLESLNPLNPNGLMIKRHPISIQFYLELVVKSLYLSLIDFNFARNEMIKTTSKNSNQIRKINNWMTLTH